MAEQVQQQQIMGLAVAVALVRLVEMDQHSQVVTAEMA
jgi:hypothetical protein